MSTEKQQSAVEWLVEQLFWSEQMERIERVVQQAKEKELDKLKEAYAMGRSGKSIKEFNESFNQKI
jgi:hypothetical protein